MKIKKGQEKNWKEEKEVNKNLPECIKYIENWTERMEEEIEAHKDEDVEVVLERCANRYEHEYDTIGLSGAMFSILLKSIIHYWEYGDILEKFYWHGFYLGKKEVEKRKKAETEREKNN